MEKSGRKYIEEIGFGDFKIPNRVMMAALTRMRADPKTGVPTEAHAQHYSDRADFGIILTECSQVSPMGEAFPGSCGIYSDAQTAGWKKVVDAVHAKGGRIFLQIWHGGRATDSAINNQKEIWGPSAVAISTEHTGLKKPHQVPKAMTLQDITQVKSQFRKGAENAKKAGFDGVQLHGAHGYLIDEFLKDGCNQRTDEYGGSVENRSRLCLQVIDILISVFGNQRVGIKLSPTSAYNFDTTDSDPVKLLDYLVPQLDKRGVTFIQFNENNDTKQIDNCCQLYRSRFSGVLVANWGYDLTTGLEIIQSGAADMVSFGQLAIANPDLVTRIQNNWSVNTKWDFRTFFASHNPGSADPGYNDYATYEEQLELYKKRDYLEEITVGDLKVPNRVMMAALTRQRADPKTGVPNEMHVKYYSDRADFGIILTEASQVAQIGEAFPGACGIYTEEQVAGWKKVVDQVHEKGGRIYLQMFHSGRATDPEVNRLKQIWAPSPIAINHENNRTKQPYPVPKEMTLDDIQSAIAQFRDAAENAKKAGFDGVQLHGAHGYLIDQFLKSNSNQRTDQYGGSIEKRAQFCLQVIDELIAVFGQYRVGIKLSPCSNFNFDTTDQDPVALFTYLIKQLQRKRIAFIEFNQTNPTQQIQDCCSQFRHLFTGTFAANWGYDESTGLEIIRTGAADMVSFGKLAISNPDLIKRLQRNLPVNQNWDMSTFFTAENKGYNDYLTYEEAEGLQQK